ncbi:MAG: GtrA family protein [Pseudomonadota bacterium]|nr:GtrA family protein [Pseudomonadota bacterium]
MDETIIEAARPEAKRQLLHQWIGFCLVGGVEFVLDWGVLVGLSAIGVPVAIANTLGRLAGACLGYWANGRFTFRARARMGRAAIVRSAFLFVATTVISSWGVELAAVQHGLLGAWLLKPLIEAVLGVACFFVSKYWVYR